LEREDIRLDDRENEMRGEGVGEDRRWPETLYESHQLTSKRKRKKGRNTVVPFYDHKQRYVSDLFFINYYYVV
jgi:hypothetical protein